MAAIHDNQSAQTRQRIGTLAIAGVLELTVAGSGALVAPVVAAGGGRAYGLLVWIVSAAVAVVGLTSLDAAARTWLHSRQRPPL